MTGFGQSWRMILTGDYAGSEFAIATTDETEKILKMREAFNRMNAEGAWEVYADTITFYTPDGTVVPFTLSDAKAYFDVAKSIEWNINSLIPLKITGTDIVKVIMDGNEVVEYADGTIDQRKLIEIFTFENGKIVEVHQWDAKML